MVNYNFHSLSSSDLEILARDLLQKHLDIYLDNFKSGRDGGIDLRSSKSKDGILIVQCKHFLNSPYSALITELKKEVPKINALKPNRYIIVTTQGLTQNNKEEIKQIFDPYIISTEDIYSRENLNNLLTLYPEIEKRHYKLWLSSQNVLEKILHNEIFNRTEISIESIKRRMRLYVQNESYFKAREVLNDRNCCIIAGAPGIGKTTLAEMLLIEYLANDFEIYKLSDIKEAFKVYSKKKKQVFYYDDFLGQTSLDIKLRNQEDEDIIELMNIAKSNPNTKFILTTREYILNQAKTVYEKLASPDLEKLNYIIRLDNYTRLDKAKILYNHIYFSDLPKELLDQIITDRNYKKIIDHKNYNPRIIEKMTIDIFHKDLDPSNYFSEFLSNLDNPMRIWEHAFNYQLSDTARNLLLVIATLPEPVAKEDLRLALNSFEEICDKKSTIGDFDKALRELLGSFIDIDRVSNKNFVKYNNPSIKDYIEYYLSDNPEILSLLCRSIIFFDQCVKVRNFSKKEAPLFLSCMHDFLESLERSFKSASITYLLFNDADHLRKEEVSYIHRYMYVRTLSDYIPEDQFNKTLSNLENSVFELAHLNKGEKHHFLIILDNFNNYSASKSESEWVQLFKKILLNDLNDIYSYDILTDLRIRYQSEFSFSDYEYMRHSFIEFHDKDFDTFLDEVEDEDELTEYARILEGLASYFSIDVEDFLDELASKMHELFSPDHEPDFDYEDDWRYDDYSSNVNVDDQIDMLFDGLKD